MKKESKANPETGMEMTNPEAKMETGMETGMETEKKNKRKHKKGFIIGIVCAIILVVCAAAIIMIHFVFMPQVRVVDALVNTLATAGESDIDQKYGGYAMVNEMLSGTYDLEISYDGAETGIRRNEAEKKFQIFADLTIDGIPFISGVSGEDETGAGEADEKTDGAGTTDEEADDSGATDEEADSAGTTADEENGADTGISINGQFYVDAETSILEIGNKDIRLDYADHLTQRVENSILGSIDLGGDAIVSVAEVYVELMQALSGTAAPDNTFDGLYERTLDFFLNLESERQEKKTFEINGKKVKCQVYLITFNAEDLAVYVEDCYNIAFTTGEKVNQLIRIITGYTVEELFDLAKEKAADMKEVDIYFAVDNEDRLVSIYSSNISEKGINFSLDFLGGDYLCDEVEFKWSDAEGRGMNVVRDDISTGEKMAVKYEYSYYDSRGMINETTIKYTFEDDRIILEQETGGESEKYEMDIVSYEKGKYIEVAGEDYTVYIGSRTKDIEMPEGEDSINILDAGIFDAYSFFRDFEQ